MYIVFAKAWSVCNFWPKSCIKMQYGKSHVFY